MALSVIVTTDWFMCNFTQVMILQFIRYNWFTEKNTWHCHCQGHLKLTHNQATYTGTDWLEWSTLSTLLNFFTAIRSWSPFTVMKDNVNKLMCVNSLYFIQLNENNFEKGEQKMPYRWYFLRQRKHERHGTTFSSMITYISVKSPQKWIGRIICV